MLLHLIILIGLSQTPYCAQGNENHKRQFSWLQESEELTDNKKQKIELLDDNNNLAFNFEGLPGPLQQEVVDLIIHTIDNGLFEKGRAIRTVSHLFNVLTKKSFSRLDETAIKKVIINNTSKNGSWYLKHAIIFNAPLILNSIKNSSLFSESFIQAFKWQPAYREESSPSILLLKKAMNSTTYSDNLYGKNIHADITTLLNTWITQREVVAEKQSLIPYDDKQVLENLIYRRKRNLEKIALLFMLSTTDASSWISKPFTLFRSTTANKKTPLSMVITDEHIVSNNTARETAGILLTHFGAHVNQKNIALDYPLYLSLKHRMYDLAEVLIKHTADVNSINGFFGHSPLHAALSYCAPSSITKLLLEKGASVTYTDNNGSTPLHSAAHLSQPDEENIRSLIKHGANINAQDKRGNTPLHVAYLFGFYYTAQFLISCGADSTLLNHDGKTPLKIGNQSEQEETETDSYNSSEEDEESE